LVVGETSSIFNLLDDSDDSDEVVEELASCAWAITGPSAAVINKANAIFNKFCGMKDPFGSLEFGYDILGHKEEWKGNVNKNAQAIKNSVVFLETRVLLAFKS
jgi:hypothetical protein